MPSGGRTQTDLGEGPGRRLSEGAQALGPSVLCDGQSVFLGGGRLPWKGRGRQGPGGGAEPGPLRFPAAGSRGWGCCDFADS